MARTLGKCCGCDADATAYVDDWTRPHQVRIVTGDGAYALAQFDPLPVFCGSCVLALVARRVPVPA